MTETTHRMTKELLEEVREQQGVRRLNLGNACGHGMPMVLQYIEGGLIAARCVSCGNLAFLFEVT